MDTQETYTRGMEYLVDVVQQLSLAKTLEEVVDITRHAARELTGADGAAFVLRDEDRCYYVDEDAIGPLWKGSKFPMTSCISGWSMMNQQSVAIEDIFSDPRIPIDAYRVTFVKSLLVVPIRVDHPIGAIGNYWAKTHTPTPQQQKLLEALANSTSIALENIQLYKDLKTANAYLAESLKARDEFFMIASHELRTPMSTITLELQMAERKLQKLMNEEKPLRHSIEQVKKLGSEIEALFDVNQIRSGDMKLSCSVVDVSEILEDELSLMKSDFDASACAITSSIKKGLSVDCDPQKIRQVFRNILSNLVRHAPECGASITLSQAGNSMRFSVEDTGGGITQELHEKLLRAFERGHTPRRLGGLGLGLFIARSYVEAHGGTLTIEHGRSSGARFDVTIPLKQEALSKVPVLA